jgi:carboxymethylenebutenolidase
MDYVAAPEVSGPGVLVVHDGYGLLPHVRERCDDLAAAGFVALAPDLLEGSTEARLDVEEGFERLIGAFHRLRSHPAVVARGVGAIGYSTGGRVAVRLAATGALDALVLYYTVGDLKEAALIRCPVLALFAEIDDWDPPEAPLLFLDALRAQRPRVEDVTYPGTRHSFANTDVAGASPLAADRAWARTLNFLRAHL